MARNKNPEETVNLILDVSLKLFLEKGYEHTSIQDIINGLGGLTKGAIYHHFKSKEEIMMAVTYQLYGGQEDGFEEILADTTMSGLDKLKKLLHSSLDNPRQNKMFTAAPNLLKSPMMLASQMQELMEITVPRYIQPLIEEGIEDGSIKTQYPKQLAEVTLLLLNLWMTPMVFYTDPESMRNRFLLFKEMMEGIGVDFFDDSMLERFMEFCRLYSKKK